jgi:hypothetical protein
MSAPRKYRGLYLTRKILQVYPNGFCGAIVSGARGIGKSSFALNVGWEVFRNLGYSEKEAWNKTLEVVKFTIEDVIDFIEQNIMADEKAHLLIWDDAGVYASTLEWWGNKNVLRQLKGVLDTIRTGVCSMIITTPSETDLTKILRNYDDYIVQIRYSDDSGSYRIAKGYLRRTLPSGKRVNYTKFKNKFYVMLPDDVFKRYMVMREAVLTSQINKLREALETQKAHEEYMKKKLKKYEEYHEEI